MKNAIATWSGGKDSCLALYKAQQQGYHITSIANTVSKMYKRVGFHGVQAELIQKQADALGIPLLQTETTAADYNQEFIENIKRGLDKNIKAIVFGDIHLEECYGTSQAICNKLNVELVEPLWKMNQMDILHEFIDTGFEAVIVSAQANILGKEWVGRRIDQSFVDDIAKRKDVDACGENGEFHTFVMNGPNFKQKIKIKEAGKILREGFWFLDIRSQ